MKSLVMGGLVGSSLSTVIFPSLWTGLLALFVAIVANVHWVFYETPRMAAICEGLEQIRATLHDATERKL